ncbi:MAG: Ca-activated chloride channel family protein [Cryomorphaceae bacterium]|jgi:Ca-activated chloride channel family protein
MFKFITIMGSGSWLLLASTISCASTGFDSSAGELEIIGEYGQVTPALLLDTAISGEVNGMVASITIEQVFKNSSADWVNGRYVFPLPQYAALDSMQLMIGERLIKGIVQAKAEAKKTFEAAKKAGKKAGLVKQHRANLFSMSVANIGPNETIVATLTYVSKVEYQNNTFSLTLPSTLTPRYIPGAPIKLALGLQSELSARLQEQANIEVDGNTGWASNTDLVQDAADITPPQRYAFDSQSTHRFSLSLKINAGLSLYSISSATHALNEAEIDSNIYQLELANQTELMNLDLQISWQPHTGTAPTAAIFQQKLNNAYYSMVVLTPPQVNATVALPRDITFVIDSSGSMAGESMRQAKTALNKGLDHLSPQDRFNIVDFDSDFSALFELSQNANSINLTRAQNMVDSLVADGGTEMVGALKFAIQQISDPSYLKQIVFITDGAIGNEAELFKLIATQLGDSRLFTVGIGSAPNAYFMNKAAKFGRGSYTTIHDQSQVQSKIAELFSKITKPVMRDVSLDWSHAVEQYPQRIPDLYAGEPITVLVKSAQPLGATVARGALLATPWEQTLSLNQIPSEKTSADNLDTVWARAKVADVMDKLVTGELSQEDAKKGITELGIEHSIVTKFTSLVAVEQTPSKPKDLKAKQQNVPNLMPKGSAMPLPHTATPATLLTMLGSLMILLSAIFRRRQRALTSSRVLEA